MSEPSELIFDSDGDKKLLLPITCSISVSCFESQEVQQAVAATTKEVIYGLALDGMNLLASGRSHGCAGYPQSRLRVAELAGRSGSPGDERSTRDDGTCSDCRGKAR